MKKQMFKIIATFSFLVMLAALSINAQAQTAKINIPFGFSAGNKTLPAGAYTIKRVSEGGSSFIVRNEKGRAAVIIPTSASLRDSSPQASMKLVFNRYGSMYFLSQVWMPNDETGHQVPMSRAERGLKRELASRNLQPQQVSLLISSKR